MSLYSLGVMVHLNLVWICKCDMMGLCGLGLTAGGMGLNMLGTNN